MANALLSLVRVTKEYPAAEGGPPVVVLREVSLEIERGESVAVVGPSGSGKSTLLHLMGTLDQPSRGEVWLEGRQVGQLGDRDLAAVRNRQLGFVFQSHHLLPHCTVWENVLTPTLAAPPALPATAPGEGEPKPEPVEARARRLLERVGLGARMSHRPGQLSGGERQRAAVVRALINQPPLLLADEPTGALDHTSARDLGQLLVELNREEGVTLVVVTHAPELAQQMERQLELRDGQLQQPSKA